MRQVSVFVNDYPNQRRLGIGFSARDYDLVEERWSREDEQLARLQSLPAFRGYRMWSQCRTEHFRVLIMQTMTMMSDLSDGDRSDPDHPVMASFNFYVLCLVRALEIASSSTVEILHINRITHKDLAFDYSAVMDLKFAQPPPLETEEDPSPFKIIVDNTKDQ
jgi:hypothetical protein